MKKLYFTGLLILSFYIVSTHTEAQGFPDRSDYVPGGGCIVGYTCPADKYVITSPGDPTYRNPFIGNEYFDEYNPDDKYEKMFTMPEYKSESLLKHLDKMERPPDNGPVFSPRNHNYTEPPGHNNKIKKPEPVDVSTNDNIKYRKGIYMWTDEKGVKHYTNRYSTIPQGLLE